ncbi:MAG: hypothetical protein M1818_007883 [Claussenomyces sp. TS43310]|nr:MAG: hypothetical protein M1818_007883 [Claussenomyces sp. TS43310]
MADQCIVCLESLNTSSKSVNPIYSENRQDGDDAAAMVETPESGHMDNDQPVAIIRTCGHILHDECLSAWTQKANSCPICRQAFYLVDVYDMIGGNLISTRTVEDKKQVAEFDPSAWIDDQVEEYDAQPCPICGSAENEETLLLCDACDAPYHTHCVGLDHIPHDDWYCMECVHEGATDRPPESVRTQRRPRQPRTFTQRTQAQARRARLRHSPDAWQGAWSQISARVWDALNLDLENDDDDESLTEFRRLQRREDRQRRDFHQWQQRLAIAGRQGARDVFRSAASPILNSRERHETPEQSVEERKAWDAFEKAREGLSSNQPGSRKRKSRSVTASPVEGPAEPERKLKRPRTRRLNVERDPTSSSSAETSLQPTNRSAVAPSSGPSSVAEANAAPSFLSSLLKEVEMGTPTEEDGPHCPIGVFAASPIAEWSSPASSNHSTPRAMSATPPPHDNVKRPGSPLPLTSRVEPIYPPADYLPSRSLPVQQHQHDSPTIGASTELRQPQPRRRHPHGPSQASSPIRANMSIETKEDINKIVRLALEPHYKKPAGISKEQYANINRLVSRMLYDRIATLDALDENKSTWEKIANAEVIKAIEGLTA